MKKLLRLDCSSRIFGSHSRELADYFEKEWKIANPNGIVLHRDLTQEKIPHIKNSTIEGFYTPKEQMTEENIKATALSDKLISELKSVDEILISSPLYNLNIPSNLKAYLDQIVRIGHTFNNNDSGYYGMVVDKIAHIITTKGGFYVNTPMEKFDYQESYLRTILGYLGINNQKTYSLEGTTGDTISLSERKARIQKSISEAINNENL